MTLEFIYGTASQNHQYHIVKEAKNWLDRDKENLAFYIVPNHVKFEAEVTVLEQFFSVFEQKQFASLQLQVFSFSRLAWFFLQHTPYYQKNKLSDAGVSMLIRKLLLQNEEQLTVFRGEIKKSGFIQQLSELFTEFSTGLITSDSLETLIDQQGTSSKELDFKGKLSDIHLLYSQFETFLFSENINSNRLLLDLATYLKQIDLSKMAFFITGFSSFSANERFLLETLIQKSGKVVVDLVADESVFHASLYSFELFYDSGRIYKELKQIADNHQIPCAKPKNLPKEDRNETSLSIQYLDNYWIEAQKIGQTFPVVQENTKETLRKDLHLWNMETPYNEITQIAKEIKVLVSKHGYRFKDIQILSRELPIYQPIIRTIFTQYDLPYYIDQKIAMKHHPLLEFIESLFSIQKRKYRYTDIMRFLRTELFMPEKVENCSLEEWEEIQNNFRMKVDQTENVVLAYGYEGFYWTQEKDWAYLPYNFETEEIKMEKNGETQLISNEIRRSIRNYLSPFFHQLEKAKDGREAVRLFYHFLEAVQVPQQLLFWRDQEIHRGNLEQARNHEQTWQALINLLDEFVTLLGEERFELEEFTTILTSGLTHVTYGKIPATLDEIAVSTYDAIQSGRKKISFMIGVTDQVLPAKVENKTLLSDEERNFFDNGLNESQYLAKTAGDILAKEPFKAYLAFTSATKKLYMTYPLSSEHNKECKISPYVQRISKELGLPILTKKIQLVREGKTQFYSGTLSSLLSDFVEMKALHHEEQQAISEEWKYLEQYLLQNKDIKLLATKVFASQNAQNIPEKLYPEIIQKLYTDTLYSSVSRIESFYQCEYKYLLTYGLKLRERENFDFSPAATGDFFHDALDQLFKLVIERQYMLSELTLDQVRELTKEILQQVFGEQRFAMLHTSNRLKYIRYQLAKTIQKVSWALKKQSERTGMTTIQTEVLFGQIALRKGLHSLDFPLNNQKELKVRGKIDRIDLLASEDQNFISVVDYKSSPHTFDFRDAYYGLAMQMITYLDIALRNAVALTGKQAKAAGAFYLHVKNPVLLQNNKENQSTELLEAFRYNGLLIQNEEMLKQLDSTVKPKMKSLVYPFNETAKGEIKSTQFVTEKELTLLVQHNQTKFTEAGNKIYSGEVALNPAYKDKQRIACTHCPFRSVCQFDVLLKENEYHRMKKMKKIEVLQALEEKLLQKNESEDQSYE